MAIRNVKTKAILCGLFAAVVTILIAQSEQSFAENEDRLTNAVQNSLQVSISPTTEQQTLIDKVDNIDKAINLANSESEKASLALEKERLRPELIENGMIFAEDFHTNPEYWTDTLRDNGPLAPLNSNHTLPTTTAGSTTTNNVYFTYYDTSQIKPVSHSEGDWYLVHKLYYSCWWNLICNKGLWEYADDGDWSSVTITIVLNHGSYIKLEHEASNLRHSAVTRDFDSYWTHTRGSSILDFGTKFTTQYWTAFEREIQSGLLTTSNAQTSDTVYSTMRIS